ncbi:aldo/keto reductase [Allomuricauda sp. CP2A]|jgi:aryl-alcohol dehydrogenase-like predicted oxidoreductase|uniref:aldo/keto reductase n=1 Tax=Allomuricauda sp. CP2A TaxID=1848189 RepID=UPI000829E436|nr:aldo/keto reductase [Muricauda sp. CP2A]
MKRRPLGNTGINVSEIAFGGVEIGMPYGIGVSSEADMLSRYESINLLHEAVDRGINFFDTARMYGASEEIMGQAFKTKRDQVVISTKCCKLRDKSGDLPSSKKIKELIEKSLQESLLALQTNYVDVYMLHQADLGILENEDIAQTFSRLKRDGIIRATGASTYSLGETKKTIESGNWDVVQLPYNLMDQTQEINFSLAEKSEIGIMVRSVLFKGILSKKGRSLHSELREVEKHIGLYKELCDKLGCDLPTLAVKFALSSHQVSSVLVGIDRMEYLENSISAANGTYLEVEQLKRLKELQYPDIDFLDLVKWEREGWLT